MSFISEIKKNNKKMSQGRAATNRRRAGRVLVRLEWVTCTTTVPSAFRCMPASGPGPAPTEGSEVGNKGVGSLAEVCHSVSPPPQRRPSGGGAGAT